jgi:energy-coupling factor transport system ATP-binding protein
LQRGGNLIKFDNFSFYYGGQSTAALLNINLEVRKGEFVLITGPSGGGKSTLVRCFNGLVPHFYGGQVSGSITVQGINTLKSNTAEMATRVGMVFQDPENQIVATTVERELAFGMENLGFPRGLIARRIEESLDTMGIFNLRRRAIQDLSGGEKQKVAIAAVLALHPEVLVLDEPTSELDPQSAEDVLSIVKRLNEDLGITVVLIEHRLDRLLPFADRLIIMDKGRIKIDGTIRDILNSHFAEINEMGIGVPPIVRLAKTLESGKVRFENIPLTVKEGRVELEKVLGSNKPAAFHHPEKADGKAIIRAEKLSFAYPGNIVALKNINLEIYRGELVSIMGRNASGKSTLISHFNGLLKPSQGKVWVDGKDTRQSDISGLARKIGFVFQNPDDHLFADTVEDEVSFALKNFGYPKDEIESRVNEMIRKFRLDAYRKQYPRSLSGGEKQRVALASVIVAQPQILVLDEPTRGMHQGLKDELMRFLKEYTAEGRTVILVSHDVETVAEYADRVILLSEGEVVIAGNRYEVLSKALLFSPQINRLVQSFNKQGIEGDILTVSELAKVLQ